MAKLHDGNGSGARVTSEILDRIQPVDSRAEMVLLGSALVDHRCLDDVSHIRDDDFYDVAHSTLYRTIRTMHDAGKRLDTHLIHSELKRLGLLEVIGGSAYLAELLRVAPNAVHAIHYAKIVKAHSIRRQLIDASGETIREAFDTAKDVEQVVSRAESRVYAIQDKRDDQAVVPFKTAISDALDRIDRRMKTGVIEGVTSSGFDNIDKETGGFRESEVTILAARTSMGKTALAINIVHRVAKKDNLVLFFSLEMSAEELTDRALVAASKLNSNRMRAGTLSDDERGTLVESASSLSLLPIHFDASSYQTMSGIAAQVRRIHRKENRKIGLIVIDYLQLIQPDDERSPREQQVAKISRRLKLLAKEFNAPVLCLAQMNRQSENRADPRPKLSDLRESGAIEQDADNVWFIHRPEVYAKGKEKGELAGLAELLIGKQRNGPRDVVAKLVFIKESMRFEDAAPERFEVFDKHNKGSEPYTSEGF
jgi:replicative DNA helicase